MTAHPHADDPTPVPESDATGIEPQTRAVMTPSAPPALEIREPVAIVAGEDLYKRYGHGPGAVHALNGVSLAIAPGSFTAIMGPSGSGKSTLMHLLAGLDTPSSGEVWIGPTRLGDLGEADRTRLRRSRIGFVFQTFNLLGMLTAEQNITLPLRIAGRPVDREWLDWLLIATGIADKRRARPAELSGGEQQRVALARALMGKPAIVFADEPTGNLDSVNTDTILTMLRRAVGDLGQTIVIVTHDPQAAARADRIVFLEDGRIIRET
ncbi:ABC transporter ATP-binding protein [Conexibacter sp. DBS9H8]|uniref:ABC transporter ATP-binding protein n=1 Tax=Conexibacter sp. DBS9H8 TaxID=2937801 RepID=UPI00200C2655|nr:ABC transporter ATP-binding protein [Conexibacter sp. DBS9H8]